MFKKLMCLLGYHDYKETGIEEKMFVDEVSHSYEIKEKRICQCCNKEEWI